MKLVEIEALVAKYYNGETSLKEEKYLAEYFLTEDVPEHLLAAKEQFVFLSSEENKVPVADMLDEKVLSVIGTDTSTNKSTAKIIRMAVIAVAAGFLLILAIRSVISDSNNLITPENMRATIKTDSNSANDSIEVINTAESR